MTVCLWYSGFGGKRGSCVRERHPAFHAHAHVVSAAICKKSCHPAQPLRVVRAAELTACMNACFDPSCPHALSAFGVRVYDVPLTRHSCIVAVSHPRKHITRPPPTAGEHEPVKLHTVSDPGRQASVVQVGRAVRTDSDESPGPHPSLIVCG